VLGVVGHVNSGVTIAASTVYQGCGLAMLTPMSSNPAVTDRGLPNVFRLTNRDDHKGPGLAAHLYRKLGKRRAVVVDDKTPYGKGLADLFATAFTRLGGQVLARPAVDVGQTDFRPMLTALPRDFDVLFFGGVAEGALIVKQMREQGLDELFACGDGCWDVKGFIRPSEGAATKGEGAVVLSAAPALGRVPGSAEFAERYARRYGPIANYAANSYDSARIVLRAIEAAARAKGGRPTRTEVVAALRSLRHQGVAYARPVEWDAKGDNTAAVIFVNVVEGDRFREVGEITREDVAR
jgi:branched-chain amino acid transport system substrate-binding protein